MPLLSVPDSWAWATLGEIAEVVGGVTKDTKKQSDPALPLVPYLRVANVQRGRLDLGSVAEIRVPEATAERLRLQSGDVLLNEGGDRDKLGRGWVWEGQIPECIHQNHVFRARLYGDVLHPKLLAWFANECAQEWFEANGKQTTNLASISLSVIKQLPVPIPPYTEQQRIVTALDGHLSRLDLVDRVIDSSLQKLKLLTKRILVEAVPFPCPAHWKTFVVKDVGDVDLGRQRHPDWHSGPNMRPYLRVANVFEDRIDTGDLMEMDFPPEVFERYRLSEGDILLNEGQSPEYLGRPAMYRGEPKGVAFTNSLLRFRAGPEVDPEWALIVFRRHMHAGRFMQETRITTNIAHLSAGRFKAVEFPVPPLEEQRQIVKQVRGRLADIDLLASQLNRVEERAGALRSRLLADAFSGRLVHQDPTEEPAAELLKRNQPQREALRAKRPRRTARASRAGSGDLAQKDAEGGGFTATKSLSMPPTTVGAGHTGKQEALFQQEGLTA
ncbi:restriction endonuclease subunit S [Sphaerimonospora sp. CA-214678]|uniref:restriction endonuclease subunit S n=1 Tax=Sphaerimonospora sp. CA-214678 TaxID=3240029 RepID=UPI003D929C89